ncbi:TSUP family transporter, partial [Escherichia coli]|nr:TSUP family transporter [Escherichia coli]
VEILLISVFAGVVGSLLGLGGGIIVTPALTLIFGIDIQYAIGASIISVIATSSGSAIAYIKDGITNLRVGMFLEI